MTPKAETWVQVYPSSVEPGPDGSPVNVATMWHSDVWGVDRTTTRDVRGGRLTQQWRLGGNA